MYPKYISIVMSNKTAFWKSLLTSVFCCFVFLDPWGQGWKEVLSLLPNAINENAELYPSSQNISLKRKLSQTETTDIFKFM